jgi:hypothetical protein
MMARSDAENPSSADSEARPVCFTALCESGIRRDPAFARPRASALSRPAGQQSQETTKSNELNERHGLD